ncbi:MAG: glycosyltransferase [Pseudomonadota bacterium]
MQILFLHDNFPAQFGFIGTYLAGKGWDVWFGTQRKGAGHDTIKVFNYKPHRAVTKDIHPYAANFERACLTGQGVARAAIDLAKKGLKPDVVVAHSGWGPGVYVKDIWPQCRYVGYFEWFYRRNAPDTVFMGEKDQNIDQQLRTRSRNAAIMMDLAACDVGICPTEFQKDQFPDCFKSKLHVMHDGIDTHTYKPARGARLKLSSLDLSSVNELVTYVARGMEPYRGFPEFMRSLATLQKMRPNMHAVIVGEDRVAYGKPLPKGETYKQKMLAELSLDMDRVHFTGLLPRTDYLAVLQASSLHTYLTVPFVLSWSMMESMSAGCAILASDTPPVREMLVDGVHGATVDMKDCDAVAEKMAHLLADEALRHSYGDAARRAMETHYAQRDAFPAKQALFEAVARGDIAAA